jgi:dipeptidyl aminopeptidase/acylaminoacyl peptidase
MRGPTALLRAGARTGSLSFLFLFGAAALSPLHGGAPRRITRLSGQLAQPKWSPDGKTIAFLFVAGSTHEPGALVASKPDAGVVEEKIDEQRIAVADVATGRARLVSPPNLYVYDYDWSPDGGLFAAEAAEGSGTNNYWIDPGRADPPGRLSRRGPCDHEAGASARHPEAIARLVREVSDAVAREASGARRSPFSPEEPV